MEGKGSSYAQIIASRVLNNCIVTKVYVLRRGVLLASFLCRLCGEEEEIVNHLFF